MAATSVTEKSVTITPSKRKLVCFSFAAYANTVVDHLLSCNIAVAPGLSDAELSDVESSFSFSFPPDLRSLLQAGLPVSHGFPNWRSSSHQQLALLLNLPSMSLLKDVSLASFWCPSWGHQPRDRAEAVAIARRFLDGAPVLIPIYRDLYVPASPAAPGNPVFCVRGGEVGVWSFDLSGFFQEVEFLDLNSSLRPPTGVLRRLSRISPPVWAATAARRIEVWTDVAENGRRVVARGETRGWWSTGGVMGDRLEEVFWKLRDGGWSDEEVREMMAMDGSDSTTKSGPTDMESVSRQVRVLAVVLSRAGWSREDVLYSLGYQQEEDRDDENRDPNIVDFDPPQRPSNNKKVDVDE